jgi:hypothetical protein
MKILIGYPFVLNGRLMSGINNVYGGDIPCRSGKRSERKGLNVRAAKSVDLTGCPTHME